MSDEHVGLGELELEERMLVAHGRMQALTEVFEMFFEAYREVDEFLEHDPAEDLESELRYWAELARRQQDARGRLLLRFGEAKSELEAESALFQLEAAAKKSKDVG